jgi:hypothetical protein
VLNKNKITIEKIPTYNLSNLNFSLGLHLRKNKLIASSKQKIFDNFYIQEFIESNRGLLNINVRGLKYFGENKIFRPYIGLETPVLKSFYSSEHELSGIMGFENKYCLLIIKAPIKFLESIFLTPKLGSTPDIDPFSEVLVSFSSPIQQILFYFSSMLINGSLAFLNQHPHSLSYIELRLKKNIELVSIKIEAGIEYSF